MNVAEEPYLLFPSRPTRFKYTVPKKGQLSFVKKVFNIDV